MLNTERPWNLIDSGVFCVYSGEMSRIVALYDANVIFPPSLRDLLVNLVEVHCVQGKWTAEIHEEWIRNTLRQYPERYTRAKLEHTRDLMDRHGGDCLVTGYEHLIPKLTGINAGDRHVVAAAMVGHAEIIVTRNLRHFPNDVLAQFGLQSQHPDEFVAELFDLDERPVIEAVRRQRANLKNPPRTVDELLGTFLRNELLETVGRLRSHAASL